MRDIKTRKADVLAALEEHADMWLSTAAAAGRPHLIPVSAWWDGTDLVIATAGSSRTAKNLKTNRTARVAGGSPADAILIDADVVDSSAVEASPELAGRFADAVGWDPREVGPGWFFFRLRPTRIQAYRGYDELEGRDVMRDARWLA
jgi:pyridoxamine 5'-phosphate oxidase-like protein